MKEMTLTADDVVRFDDEMDQLMSPHRWRLAVHGKHKYAVARIGGRDVYMHRLIMMPAKGLVIDHIDGDGLNNRRGNLRVCTYAQNYQNAGRRDTEERTSQYKGVWRVKRPCRRCWRAGITANYAYRNIGSFGTEEEAARAYDAEARRLHGEFARPNFRTAA